MSVYMIVIAIAALLGGLAVGACLGGMAFDAAMHSRIDILYRKLTVAEQQRDAAIEKNRRTQAEIRHGATGTRIGADS